MGEMENACIMLVGKTEGKRPHGRPRRRCEDYIRIGLRDIGYEGVEWIRLAQWRILVNMVVDFRVL
jgi:hypothetical protein